MGNELNNPILEKNLFDMETNYLKFGLGSIQGWKSQMTDFSFYSTDILPNSNKKIDIFGIFDGHGGPEISKYISKIFLETFISNSSFKEGNYHQSLKETFIEIDNSLKSEKVKKELIKISEELKLKENEEILEINNTCGKGEKLSEKEIEQIKCVKDILNPRNLVDYDLSYFSGCSGIVVLITNDKIYIANAGNCQCIPLNENFEIKKDKINNLHFVTDKNEILRIENSLSFKEKKIYPEFLVTSRGFGNFEYKENQWLKPEDQAVSPEPDVIKINYDECKYLIIGSHGFFDKNYQNTVDYFIEKIKNNINTKFSKVIEDYFDMAIPKEKKDNENQSFMDNMTCFLIKLFDRPKIIEEKEEEKKGIEQNEEKKDEKKTIEDEKREKF